MTYAVIFDMDGVLVDSARPHAQSWQEMAREYGREITYEQFEQWFGRTSREILADLWGPELTAQQIAEMDDRKEVLYREIIHDNVPLIEGVRELVADLQSHGVRMAVGSSGPRENVELVVRELGLEDVLAVRISAADVTRGKPDPEIFTTAATRLEVPCRRCAVIEDAPPGLEAACRADMLAIGLTTTHSADRLEQADMVVGSLSRLNAQTICAAIDRRLAGNAGL